MSFPESMTWRRLENPRAFLHQGKANWSVPMQRQNYFRSEYKQIRAQLWLQVYLLLSILIPALTSGKGGNQPH